MKKFRFQLLHQWLVTRLELPRGRCGRWQIRSPPPAPKAVWDATVIDLVEQPLPAKFKDLRTNRQVHIAAVAIPRINQGFRPRDGRRVLTSW